MYCWMVMVMTKWLSCITIKYFNHKSYYVVDFAMFKAITEQNIAIIIIIIVIIIITEDKNYGQIYKNKTQVVMNQNYTLTLYNRLFEWCFQKHIAVSFLLKKHNSPWKSLCSSTIQTKTLSSGILLLLISREGNSSKIMQLCSSTFTAWRKRKGKHIQPFVSWWNIFLQEPSVPFFLCSAPFNSASNKVSTRVILT